MNYKKRKPNHSFGDSVSHAIASSIIAVAHLVEKLERGCPSDSSENQKKFDGEKAKAKSSQPLQLTNLSSSKVAAATPASSKSIKLTSQTSCMILWYTSPLKGVSL